VAEKLEGQKNDVEWREEWAIGVMDFGGRMGWCILRALTLPARPEREEYNEEPRFSARRDEEYTSRQDGCGLVLRAVYWLHVEPGSVADFLLA
jgi:hypothetical protein